MKNKIADITTKKVALIHIEELDSSWQEVCEGMAECNFSYHGKRISPIKFRDVHFRTPPLTEIMFKEFTQILQLEYCWLKDKTSARLLDYRS